MQTETSLPALVSALPEVYQPIFGHPELSAVASRGTRDRLEQILQVYQTLSEQLGRRLRVLDVGCAQGFVSFALAEAGADVIGIDSLQENIDVCQALSLENPHLYCEFRAGPFESFVDSLQSDQFDILISLSVFHHIAHQHGLEKTKGWINTAFEKIPFHIMEPARTEEPLYWAVSLPEHPTDIFPNLALSYELGSFPTHLSSFKRPLYLSSTAFALTSNGLEVIKNSTVSSHAEAPEEHGVSRKYFGTETKFIKQVNFVASRPNNESEFDNEVRVHAEHGQSLRGLIPCLLQAIRGEFGGTVEMERLEGQSLSEILSGPRLSESEKSQLAVKALHVLKRLENLGLFFNDVRPWNFHVGSSGVSLYDVGSIGDQEFDVLPEIGHRLSIVTFAAEILAQESFGTDLLRPARAEVLTMAFSFQEPETLRRDSSFLDSLMEIVLNWPKSLDCLPINSAAQQLGLYMETLRRVIDALKVEKDELEQRNQALLSSLSWRMTGPARYVASLFTKF